MRRTACAPCKLYLQSLLTSATEPPSFFDFWTAERTRTACADSAGDEGHEIVDTTVPLRMSHQLRWER